MVVVGTLAIGFGLVWWLLRPVKPPPLPATASAPAPAPCRDVVFESVAHIVCVLDPAAYQVSVAYADARGMPFGSVAAFDAATASQDAPPLLTMNAGMYHKDLSPVGLLVVEGRQLAPLNLAAGEGNFFMKPNGVFMIDQTGRASVMEASAYGLPLARQAFYATQSGPMLVIDGQIHPRFEPDGTSRHIRNGVGVDGQGRTVLAISRKPVSLGHFARLFREELDCRNALFLDGAISTLSARGATIIGGKHPAGPILAVYPIR